MILLPVPVVGDIRTAIGAPVIAERENTVVDVWDQTQWTRKIYTLQLLQPRQSRQSCQRP